MLLAGLLVLLAVVSVQSVHVGVPCASDDDCHTTSIMAHSSCQSGTCQCNPGYCAMDNQTYCGPIMIGTRCPGEAAGNDFCDSGVTGSICRPLYRVCTCPDGTGLVYTGAAKPFCAQKVVDPACQVCESTGGTCYNGPNGLACGCKCHFQSSTPENSIETGCDQKYAYTGQQCSTDGSVVCVDPHAECVHAGDCATGTECVCKSGYVSVRKPEDPRFFLCARRITGTVDVNCKACISHGGQCYDVNEDDVMDGCECPMGLSSPTQKPADACSFSHFAVNCTDSEIKICLVATDSDQVNDYLSVWKSMYAENKEDVKECHMTWLATGEFCLVLSYDSAQTCGLLVTDSKLTKAYSLWVIFQQFKNVISSTDVCLYSYCVYHKVAKTHTGLVDIAKKKLTTIHGLTFKPKIDISIHNKFNDDMELIGARLGDLVRLTIEYTDDIGIYKTLRAEVCIASNMLSLDHPNAKTAVFILDGCPFDGGLLTHPTPVFTKDPQNPQKIVTNFFPLPKFDCEVIFFQCCVRVCIDELNCLPKTCDNSKRRKRDLTTTLLATGERAKMTNSDLLKQYADQPGMMKEIVAVKVRPTKTDKPKSEDSRPILVQEASKMIGEERMKQLEGKLRVLIAAKLAQSEQMIDQQTEALKNGGRGSNNVLLFSVLASALVTLVIGAAIFFVVFIVPKHKKAIVKKVKSVKQLKPKSTDPKLVDKSDVAL